MKSFELFGTKFLLLKEERNILSGTVKGYLSSKYFFSEENVFIITKCLVKQFDKVVVDRINHILFEIYNSELSFSVRSSIEVVNTVVSHDIRFNDVLYYNKSKDKVLSKFENYSLLK